jgi:ElaB/YqjD/DUF883 family membrane-anchored ribosome-binding protein
MLEKHNGRDSWKTAIDSARGHFDDGFQDLARAAEQAKSQGQEAWRTAQVKARETWHDVREKGLTAWDETRVRGEELLQESQRYVRANPARAIGIAAGVGLFLGIFMSSGRSRD